MNIVCLVTGVLLFMFGIYCFVGKRYMLLKSWRNLSKKEQDMIQIKRVNHNLGWVSLLAGAIFFMAFCDVGFQQHWFVRCMVLWMVIMIADAIFIAKAKRYRVEDCKYE